MKRASQQIMIIALFIATTSAGAYAQCIEGSTFTACVSGPNIGVQVRGIDYGSTLSVQEGENLITGSTFREETIKFSDDVKVTYGEDSYLGSYRLGETRYDIFKFVDIEAGGVTRRCVVSPYETNCY